MELQIQLANEEQLKQIVEKVYIAEQLPTKCPNAFNERLIVHCYDVHQDMQFKCFLGLFLKNYMYVFIGWD